MRKLSTQELNRPGIPEYKGLEKIPLTIVLDNIRSLQNTGSVFRTADAYLIERILLCGITATPPHREIHRSALGATDSVSWTYYEDTVEAIRMLRAEGYLILGIEQTDESHDLSGYTFPSDRKTAIIFGNEVHGMQDELLPYCDACIELPQFGTKHSLNVSVCAGIVIWEFFRQNS